MRKTFFNRWLALLALLGLAGVTWPAHAQTTDVLLFGLTNVWKYNQTTSYDGSNWTARLFDDATLPGGRGVLAVEDAGNPFAIALTNTTLTLGRLTYYFRTHFAFTNNRAGVSLTFSNLVDDGAVFYLNGVELRRLYLPAAPTAITYTNLATSHDATSFDVFTLSGPIVETNLLNGDNVLAVEVHQTTAGSTDIVFGSALIATIVDTNPPPTLRMPPTLPTYGYMLTNAFGVSFTDPVALASPPGETNRLFVLEQAGRVAVMTNLAAPNRSVFLDISSRIVGGVPSDERGLLGLAFHPGYATNGYFFLYYTRSTTTTAGSGDHQQLSRFQVTATNANVALASSEVSLLTMRDEAGNHNGGCLQFGPDGYLYVSLGDEGNQNDTLNNSQRIDKDFWSSILRLDVDAPFRPGSLMPNAHPANTNNAGRVINYRVPADNPFVGLTTWYGTNVNPALVHTEFYAVGFRNPWRFSFDPATGSLYCGDVGQDTWEEVDIVVKGGNYGWNYREGFHARPNSPNPPAGFSAIDPIYEHQHGSGTNQGNSISGGVVYRGSRLPALVGAYVFADYVSGNVWALRSDGTNPVPGLRLTGDGGISAFGVDPRNGDVLTCDQSDDTIKRLVYDTSTTSGNSLPPTLYDTGAFTNLTTLASPTATLTPNTGLAPYDINVHFWSDNALKSRWVFRPNTNLTIGFNRDGNWSFPTGMVWVKHFDLEMTNGVPSSARRLETRFIVKNTNGVYGVTYRWGNSLTNATLVPDEGLDETLTIYDGATPRTQVWHYPGRNECLICHTPVAGHALGFNTAQLNRDFDYGAGPTNQLAALSRAGYLSAPISNPHLLPALAHATNSAWSREWRVRSYLAANCVQCHQPGGAGLGSWDARYQNPLSTSGLIRGPLNNNGGDTNNRVVVPGSLLHSMLLTRISTRGAGQMPPLASSLLDTQAIALVGSWIDGDLGGYRSFAEWQSQFFGSTNAPDAQPAVDPDSDGANNQLEWLTGTSPILGTEVWNDVGIERSNDAVLVTFTRVANRGFEVQWTTNLFNSNSWQPLNVLENRPFFAATNGPASVPDLISNQPAKYYRVRVYEP